MATLWAWPLQPQQNVAGNAVTAAALTSGLIGSQFPVLPGGIYQPGARLRLAAHGEITSTSATPTCALGFYFGAVAAAIGSETALCASTGLPISATATAWQFTMHYEGTFRTLATGVSANGVIHGQGYVLWFGNTGLTALGNVYPMPITAAARTVSTFNTQANTQIDVGITLSVTTGAPSVTITDFWAELVG
jgi:hypothetical protein